MENFGIFVWNAGHRVDQIYKTTVADLKLPIGKDFERLNASTNKINISQLR